MDTRSPHPGVSRPNCCGLLGTAMKVTGQHVNRCGHSAACSSRWPCRQGSWLSSP